MRPKLHLPFLFRGTKSSALVYFVLLNFMMIFGSYASLAKSIDKAGCMWEVENTSASSALPSNLSLEMVLMDVLPADTTICAGQSIQFSVAGVDPTYSYEWSATDGTFNDINAAMPIYTILSAGIYSVIVILTDQDGNNVGFFEATVNVVPPIAVSINTAGETCDQLGSINLSISGGSGIYITDWADLPNANNSEDRNNLTAGTYSVNIFDDLGCSQTTSIVVPQLCNNSCPASAGTITANEGFLCVPDDFITIEATPDNNMVVPNGFQLSYLLTTGANSLIVQTNGSPAFDVTAEGAYTIHPFVYDPNTFDFSSIVVNTTTLLDVNAQLLQGGGGICGSLDLNGATTLTEKAIGFVITSTPETCNALNGQVILAPPSSSFEWFDGVMGSERNDLADGIYFVTVSQSSGCSGVIEITVDEACQCSVVPTVSNIVIFEATCGNSNGSATLQMVDNNNSYTYQWDPAVSSSNVGSNLSAGSYSVTITESGDEECFSVETFIIGNSDGPQVTLNSTSPANCSAPNGSASLSPSSLNYTWCDGGNGASRNDLSAGICVVTVTDPNTGCINTIEVEIGEINNLSTTLQIIGQPNCNAADGVVTVLASGGSGNYSFIWNDGAESSTRFGLAAGTYVVTITDGNDGCTAIETFTLTNAIADATVNISSNVALNCSGDNNGFVNYNVQFSGGFVQPANEVIRDAAGNMFTNGNLTAGNYCILIYDGNGCLAGESCFEVTQPDPISLDISVNNQTCAQQGSILVFAVGGNNSYTYDWADLAGGNDPANRTDLEGGNYNLTVVDGNGCAASANIIVTNECNPQSCLADAGTLAIDANPVCLVAGNATISATPQGNINVPSGYSTIFVLTNGGVIQTVGNSPVFSVSNVADYTIHTLVYHPDSLDLSIVTPGVTTAADVLGLLIQGGGSICASLDVPGATASVITCDGGPCTSPPQLLNIVKTASSCGTSTGTATVNMVGGNNAFTYSFSSGNANGNSVSGLALGTYDVTITDTNNSNCVSVESFSITNADGPSVSIISTSATSCDATNGTASLDSPSVVNYLWCNGETGSFASNLAAGVCPVTITDQATGCTNIVEVEIEAADLLQVTPLINGNPDCGMSNGVVVLQVSGGSNNYTFQWSDANSIDNAIRNDLPGGTFGVTVTDNGPNGCVGTTTFTLTENITALATVDIQDMSMVSCPGDANGSVQYSVNTDPGFVQPVNDRIVDANGNVFQNGALPAGDYCVEVSDGNGCVAGSACFTIVAPDAIIIDVSVLPTTCSQGGTININVLGGSGSYSYDWDDLGGNNDPANRFDLSVGIYGVTVTDNNSCTAALSNIQIVDGCTSCSANAGTLQADSSTICFGGTPLTISASQINAPIVPGGFNLLYVLTSGAGLDILQANATPDFSVNAIGNYTIHTLIFDPATLNPNDYSNGIDLNADLLQGGGTICASLDVSGAAISLINCGPCTPPTIQSVVTIESTCGNSDGSATVNVVGNSDYTFQWSEGTSTTNTNLGLAVGTYIFTVTDASNPNCSIVDSLIIANSDGPEMSVFSQTPTSCNASNGTAVLQPQTNLFDWSDGTSGAIRTDLAPGVNVVTVTDPATNCTNVYEVFIESIQSLEVQVSVLQQPDCQTANGAIDLTVTGGSTNYTYIWSDNANIDAPDRSNLPSGTYGVTVIDNGPNACEEAITFVLLDNVVGATVSTTNPNNEFFVSCAGLADGEIDYIVTPDPGFAAPSTEMIIDGNGMEQTNGQLAPGNYCLVVKDANGCVAGQFCFEVIDAEPINVDLLIQNATCDDPGGITTIATGGTGFLLFNWDDLPNSSNPQNRFNLAPGLYNLTVTDGNGCSVAINDILVQDECISDCPSTSQESLILPINTTDSFCVVLDTCFVASATTYEILGGGTSGSSIYGSWNLSDEGCLIYAANDTAGVFVDTIYILSNFNVLTDTTILIVTVLPECDGADIFSEESITLSTSDCVEGAGYCLEIELEEILNFSMTDNGQPFDVGMNGCNFDTTFFYSLSAFLNAAPTGPYSLTGWVLNNNTFTIDSFQNAMQLVDSMNVWDTSGNWMLNGGIITGGSSSSSYGNLGIIQLDSGASTLLDVDFNQIPNGTLITLDTGFHELIITDLVTGCNDTLMAEVICDDCPIIYSGPSTVVGLDCNQPTDLCLDIPFTDFMFNYDIVDNGLPYTGIRKGCGFDTLSTCYLISALPDQGTAGPYSVDTWAVGNVTFSSTFNDLQELLNLMNGWDPTGNWTLDANGESICGGTPGQFYGQMIITQTNTGAIAELEPDYVILTFASAIELDTGFHELILVDTINGCTDTLAITIDCDVVTGGVDTLLEVMVSSTDTFCFNLTDTIVSAINLCPDFSDGNVAGFGFIPNTNCIQYTGSVVGLDTFCMVFEYIDGTVDTSGIVIQVVPQLLSGDTIPVSVLINFTETFCLDTAAFLGPLDTIYNYCEDASGDFSEVMINEPNCIDIMAFEFGGLDTACIVICDTFGVCDTSIFLIEVTRPGVDTVFEMANVSTSDTFCPDTSQLFGTLVSIENVCEESSGTNADFTVDTSTFCIDYTTIEIGADTACIVICDDLGICDTTIYVLNVINPIDTIIAVDDDTVTFTINPVTIDIFGNDVFNPDSLIFGVLTGVTNGTLVINPDDSFTYLAAAGFCGGVDSFTYFISNGTIADTATVTIEVLCDDIFVFNGFSPNNDGVHETLEIQGIDNFGNNEVYIYNRWGNLVYRKEGYRNDDGWDGRFEGKDLPSGTYFYVIDDGEGTKYSGWLQIRR